jgi:hypothetical protein
MTEYIQVYLKNREFRYYNETRIDGEFKNIEGNWKQMTISDKDIYKCIQFSVDGKQHSVLLHRLIYYMNNPEWDIDDETKIIDHIIHKKDEPLDNSITNLRCVTHQQNQWNNNALGCYFNKPAKKWMAKIKINGRQKYLGYFVNKQDAIDAYQKEKLILHKIV